ncbi:MAG: glycosyltransferase family 9 protein [Phycisphaerales bacterium JB064]
MAHPPTQPERILIIRPSALGDVCRSVPVLAALRARWPQATIDWLVQDAFADAIAAHPALSSVVSFPRRDLSPLARPDKLLAGLKWGAGLRRRRYDLVIDCQGLMRSGVMTLATGAPIRLGAADARELAPLAYTRRVPASADMHAVDRMMALAQAAIDTFGAAEPIAAPDMRLYTTPEARAKAALALSPAKGAQVVVLAPTSRWPAKQWPDERFALLASAILENTDAALAVVGGPGEERQCERTRALAYDNPRVIDLVGHTGIGELMAIVQQSTLVVANDSAVLHMAVGFDRPLVALFGPTLTNLVGPYKRDADVLQHERPDHPSAHKNAANARMMRAIAAEEAISAVLERLSRCAARSRA